MTVRLTKGRAASWTATSSPFAANTPFRALSARVAPPRTIRTVFVQSAVSALSQSALLPATNTISLTRGHSSKARTLRRSTLSPPRSNRSLSKPIRVEEPAATSTAETVLFTKYTCPCPGRTGPAVSSGYDNTIIIIADKYANFNTRVFLLPGRFSGKKAPVRHLAGRGLSGQVPAYFTPGRFSQARMGLRAAARASFWAWASARSLPRVVK